MIRPCMAAIACLAFALFTAAPALAGGSHADGTKPPDKAQGAERLLRAADRFDKRAAAMRGRATRLRDTALELRNQAERFVAGETATDDPGAAARFEDSHDGIDDPTDEDPCGTPDGEGDEEISTMARTGDDGAAEGDGSDADVCELLHLAEKLEHRAAALDVAAKRMEGHATRLRDKAAKLLARAGERDAERLLAKARRLRAAAARYRAKAEEVRETAFSDADVDEEAVEAIERMELKAAWFDGKADRLEARAAADIG